MAICPLSRSDDSGVEWSADIGLGYGYDSNVVIDDIDLDTSRGDKFVDLKLGGRLRFETANESVFSGSLTVNEKQYESFDQFDGRLSIVSLSQEREFSDKTLGLAVRYIDYRLDHDDFLTIVQVSPTLSWFPTRNTFLRFAYEFNDETFETSPGRDNKQHELGVTGYYFINGLQKYVIFKAEVSRDEADDDVFANDAYELRLSYRQKINLFTEQATLALTYRYQDRDYDEARNPVIDDFRHDERHRYEVALEQPITKSLSLAVRVSANDYGSNLESVDYSQQVYQLTLGYKL